MTDAHRSSPTTDALERREGVAAPVIGQSSAPPTSEGSLAGGASSPQAQPPTTGAQMVAEMLVDRRDLNPQVLAARDRVLEARAALSGELDGLTDATRSALDIPAKVRRDPIKAAALAGGAGFLLLGGPRKVLRAAGKRLIPHRRDPYDGLLPDGGRTHPATFGRRGRAGPPRSAREGLRGVSPPQGSSGAAAERFGIPVAHL